MFTKNDFYETLSFLENYGFKYVDDEVAFVNKFKQTIKLHYKEYDRGYIYSNIVPEIHITDNNWRKIINIEEQFKFISKRSHKSYKYKLKEIIQNQIEVHKNIFGLLVID
ncbi:hypothetical protein RJI07_06110 [Mycoplasmatota bacterium WC30]